MSFSATAACSSRLRGRAAPANTNMYVFMLTGLMELIGHCQIVLRASVARHRER